ncbi:MAG: tRNA 4-thiouridine(8) synthase ThiI [Spirochaetales bacterium]|nr:tRNA 4-thiouridine(8) synthase ThiI [Spirochaetales bacterium]
MEEIYLVKIGEISLKSGNRKFFEQKLKSHIKFRLRGYPSKFSGQNGRFYLTIDSEHGEKARTVLGTSFGVTSFSKCVTVKKDIEVINQEALKLGKAFLDGGAGTKFKVESRRADKKYFMTSYELSAHLGGVLLDAYPELEVDVKNPDWKLNVEIRDKAILYGPPLRGPGGLPVGCAGKGTLLLSGGIDSPVAGYLMAKRGLKLDAVYFHAYPYTSDEAKEKVIQLAKLIAPYCGGVNLFIVPFTEAQLRIRDVAPTNEATLHMRAGMVRVAEIICRNREAGCLVTGEALSQVASQTVSSIGFTNSISNLPIFRPLIGMDKEEIIKIARKIGTYETSILPYEDCCTIFSPKHPLITPDIERISESYKKIELEEYLVKAAEEAERIYISPRDGIEPKPEK